MSGPVGSVPWRVVTGIRAWYSPGTAVILVRTAPCSGHVAGLKPLHVPRVITGVGAAMSCNQCAERMHDVGHLVLCIAGLQPRSCPQKYEVKGKNHRCVRTSLCESTRNIPSYRSLCIFWSLNNKNVGSSYIRHCRNHASKIYNNFKTTFMRFSICFLCLSSGVWFWCSEGHAFKPSSHAMLPEKAEIFVRETNNLSPGVGRAGAAPGGTEIEVTATLANREARGLYRAMRSAGRNTEFPEVKRTRKRCGL